MVKAHLKVVEEFVEKKTSDSTGRRVESIAFLETLSGIEGSSLGTEIGKLSVTKEDFKLWATWFEKHRDRVFFDSESKKVVAH